MDAPSCDWSSSSCRATKSSGSCRSKTCPRSTSDTTNSIREVPSLDGARQRPLESSVPTPTRVRHLDVRWLWAQEAVQARRFTLKKVGTTENVSDLTTSYHDEERLGALMRTGGLRFTRGLQLAASVATPVVGESQTVAANAGNAGDRARRQHHETWHVGDPCLHQNMHNVQGSLRDLWPGGAMISNPHEHQLGVALVTCGNRNAGEPRVALLLGGSRRGC